LARAWHLGRAAGAAPYWLERLRDEAAHGADWLVRMQDDAGFWHTTLFDQWTKDPAQRMLGSYRTQQGERYPVHQAGWRQGGGMAVAALAACAGLERGGEFACADYARAASLGFEHLVEDGHRYVSHGPDDDPGENIIDDACAALAAIELGSVWSSTVVHDVLTRRVERLLGRVHRSHDITWLAADGHAERSWFHASDAGLPIVVLNRFAAIHATHPLAESAGSAAAELVTAQLDLGDALPNPFGYPPHHVRRTGQPPQSMWFYPHDNPSGYWWQGENGRLASLAAAALGVASGVAAGDRADRAARAAQRWIDWILGANPFDVCMMGGRGRNNPHYADPYDNAPGGIANGITSGVEDEADIAFQPEPYASDMLLSWRWGEQWIPHAAWLLYALALRDSGARS
jgi:hypothetical protein